MVSVGSGAGIEKEDSIEEVVSANDKQIFVIFSCGRSVFCMYFTFILFCLKSHIFISTLPFFQIF